MKLIRLKEVMDKTGLGRSSIYKYISEEMFPRPVALGGRAVAWVSDEVDAWILDRIEERDGQLPVAREAWGRQGWPPPCV